MSLLWICIWIESSLGIYFRIKGAGVGVVVIEIVHVDVYYYYFPAVKTACTSFSFVTFFVQDENYVGKRKQHLDYARLIRPCFRLREVSSLIDRMTEGFFFLDWKSRIEPEFIAIIQRL